MQLPLEREPAAVSIGCVDASCTLVTAGRFAWLFECGGNSRRLCLMR
jgi:hypothetical protein